MYTVFVREKFYIFLSAAKEYFQNRFHSSNPTSMTVEYRKD